jgi:hypothetical protein
MCTIKPANNTHWKIWIKGLVPIKCAASLNSSLDGSKIISKLMERCTNKKVNKNSPINDIHIFLVMDENDNELLIIKIYLMIIIISKTKKCAKKNMKKSLKHRKQI